MCYQECDLRTYLPEYRALSLMFKHVFLQPTVTAIANKLCKDQTNSTLNQILDLKAVLVLDFYIDIVDCI